MNASRIGVWGCVLIVGLLAGTANAVPIVIDTVSVGNAGNAADTRYNGISVGSVEYSYNVGTYEVTAGQYAEFLNAVAKTDTYGLYNAAMDTAVSSSGCNIKRTGSSGSYSYTVASDWANRPVNCVSWGDAARFANWMHNDQPTGAQNASTTEDGSYALNGAMSIAALAAVTRKANATWVIPSEDEWYKSAYHKNDGVTGNYFNYPTGSDSAPSNVLGNPTDPGNNATYAFWNGTQWVYTTDAQYHRTEVGAHEHSDSPYGTFDQGGNVFEWNEAVFPDLKRGLRGGAYGNSDGYLLASVRSVYHYPTDEYYYVGFRVASVPEPATLLMLGLVSVGTLRRRGA